MKVIERRALRGPNIYAARPVYLAVIDLESLDNVASTEIPGFIDALLAAVPSLAKHRCSPGHVGGFVERLQHGTYMAHVIEHLALELQCLAGIPVGYGRARKVVAKPRQYRVVFACVEVRLAEEALNLAMQLVNDLSASRPPRMDAGMARMRQLALAAGMGPSTRAIVEAAQRRGIPTLRLSEDASLFQLGWGVKQQRLQATMTSKTNRIAVGIASNKDLTKRLLREAGLPVPKGRTVSTLDGALSAALLAKGPVVIKPLSANQGKGVTTGVLGAEAVEVAFKHARRFGTSVIVEQHIQGDDHRVLVVGGRVVAASRRSPPEVTGDGHSTIGQLVDGINADPRRGDAHGSALTRVRLDEAALKELLSQGLGIDAVPLAGERVRLRGNANLSTGGTAQDVTRQLHPDNALACTRAARKIGLDVAGIDLVCGDIALPMAAQGGAIIEVNAAPGIRMHEHPSAGRRRYAGRAILDSLFDLGDDGRVPIIAVTGSNGKTTTTLSIAHVLQRIGHVTGVATTEGITVAGQRIQVGDCTGYWSARTVLSSPEVEFAVLETARGGMLKRGLGFDRCDVGVVLNVHGDHLGLDGIETVKDLAKVKGLIVATARKAVVLNADDAMCVRLAARAPNTAEIVYFGFDATQPAMASHLASGGRAVYADKGLLVWAEGHGHTPLVLSAHLPFTLHDRARHNIANAMACFAALLALDVPGERIAAELAGFSSSESQNPLRLNIYRCQGVTLVVDYAHNAEAYEAIIVTGRLIARGRLIGVVAVPCDRRASDQIAIGRLCGSGFDCLVIYEMDDLRGKPAGQTAERVAQGARNAERPPGSPADVHVNLDVRIAIRQALAMAESGDVIIIGCASHPSEIHDALVGLEFSAVDAHTLHESIHEASSQMSRIHGWSQADALSH